MEYTVVDWDWSEVLKPREPKTVVLEDAPEDMEEETIVEENK